MASISSTSQASSSTSCPHRYDVFLSFRGEDTRTNFTDHLYNTLVAHGIHTFRDDEELEKGEAIKSGLSRAIEESKILIIIFSKNYATSKWCLNELVKIMTLKESKVVIPVFYHVNPSDVGHQSGDFGDAFIDHEKDANQEKKEMIKMWRTVLEKAAKLSGYHVDQQHETQVIHDIRSVISSRLDCSPLHVGDNIVGMDDHLNSLKALIETELDDVRMVGVFGIGGIGKTTIAMAVYNDISSQFDGSSFLKGVSEESKGGLLELQKRLLKDILKGPINSEFNNTSQGVNVIKKRLCSKRVLIVLDDVDKLEQLENLVGKNDWFGEKSRIIITTKDTSLLDQHGVIKSYEVKKLKLEEATKLFKLWAFKHNIPNHKEEFESLSHHVVRYAEGLPIALKVLGGFLSNKKIDEWKSALRKLEKIPHSDVQSILKVSYEKLEDLYKDIFLDIACFFKGKDKDFVVRILGEYGEIGIKVLHERCLITISENMLDMHDLIQQMGREIVRRECPEEPGRRTRIWHRDDVNTMLTRNSATEAIEGLSVSIYSSDQIQFTTNAFEKMKRLRLLRVHYHEFRSIFQNAFPKEIIPLLPMDFKFPLGLRYLFFRGYPLESLPTDFHAKNLVELDLRMSNIMQLWEGNKIFDKLKVIHLSHSQNLIEIPDCSCTPNLEILNLDGCKILGSIPRDFHKLKYLRILSCDGCSRLHSFPEIKRYMSKLRKIDFSETGIREVPPSIQYFNGLKDLVLRNCKHLVILPENIGSLSSLQNLNLACCAELKRFPSSIEHLKALKHLDLDGCKNLVNFPEGIFNLRSLETLRGLKYSNIERLEVRIGGCKDSCDFHILKKGVIWSNHRFSSLKSLNIQCNPTEGKILNHPPLSLLVELSIRNSSPVKRSSLNIILNQLSSVRNSYPLKSGIGILSNNFHPSSLEVVSIGNFNPIMERGIFSDIFNQPSLLSLSLRNCNLMEARIPRDIWNLSSLVELSLSNCNLMEGEILIPICQLSSLQRLSLDGNHFSSLSTAGICQLPNLRGLNLSHCKNLVQIPELPSSVQFVDAHCSDRIWSSSSLVINSLINPCNSELIKKTNIRVGASNFQGKGMSIVIPRSSGILEGTRNQNMGNKITIRLPLNWLENHDFLGFALWCSYVGAHDKFHKKLGFDCSLEIVGKNGSEWVDSLSFESLCDCDDDYDRVSDSVWVIYYPKVAIKKQCCSSQLTYLMASFSSYRSTLEEEECGIGLAFRCCFKCQTDEECQRKLCLMGKAINELPIIECPFELGSLCLRECKNLQSLPSTICEFKSLTTLTCSGCSKLKSFPEILETLENLRELHLDGTAIEQLPPSIQHLRQLQYLNLAFCNNLVSLPETICSLSCLKTLIVSFCSKLEKFPQNMMRSLQCLESLIAAGSNLSFNELSCIHVLSNLRILDLSHSQKLRQVPELLSSLRSLDVHACPCLETLSCPSSLLDFSLFKCFKAAIEEFKEVQIVIPGNINGIPEWISQQKKGSQITIELPMDWYQNNDFLGFALYSVYGPVDIESKEDDCSLKCELAFHGLLEFLDDDLSSEWLMEELWFRSNYSCCRNGDELDRAWVAYYPKVAIENEYWSNAWRHLTASYSGYLGGKPVKVVECGLHLIYNPNILSLASVKRENTGLDVTRSRDIDDDPEEDSHHKR